MYSLGKISPVSNPSNQIPGTMTQNPTQSPSSQSPNQISEFKPYVPQSLPEGVTKATFTPSQPIGSQPQSGSLLCFTDAQKTTCSFKPTKPGTVPGQYLHKLFKIHISQL